MLTMEITRLIERCRKGDADALGELYKAYARQMRGVCRRYISDEQTVDDVLHDAFIIIFTSFDRLRDVRRAEAWMTSITRNVASKCKDHLEAFPTVSLNETNEAELIATEDEGFVVAESSQCVRGVPMSEVVSMIDRLPEGYGQVFRLSVFEGMSHKEIAEMLGIEPHSSSSQLARAKKMLRKMMRHYWVAVLLMLLIPVTFFLLRKGDTAIKDEEPIVAKQKDMPKESQKDARTEHSQEPVIVHQPVHRTTVIATDTPQAVIAQAVDSVTSDTLSNIIAREQMETDTIANDTIKAVRKMEIPHYDIADIFPDKQVTGTNGEKRWSLELAYAGQFDEQNRYNQPFTYKPYIDPQIQSSPGEGPTYVVPSSIDNWTDYAIYLANNPNVVSDKTRSIIMRIALSNANLPGDDKILRTSHHRMPITWSLALSTSSTTASDWSLASATAV